jgi:hypothetical protein
VDSPGTSSGRVFPSLTGQPSQISSANQIRVQVDHHFSSMAQAIRSGAARYRSLEPAEIEMMVGVVEEHRTKVLSSVDAGYFVDAWQDPADGVARLIHEDERWKAVVVARATRGSRPDPGRSDSGRPDSPAPMRYMGFDDDKGVRFFKFGTLPVHESPIYTVQVPVNLLLKHGISFQDGPAMSSAMMASGVAQNHLVTEDDCLAFLAVRSAKAERKPARRKAAGAGSDTD